MVKINFFPESNRDNLTKAAKEYDFIWKNEGDQIVRAICRNSGLSFKTHKINAIVYEGPSFSFPLRLRASHSTTLKKTTLIHELFHRLFLDNKIKFRHKVYSKEWDKEVHTAIAILLYFTLKDLYDDEVLFSNVKKESVEEREKIWKDVLKLDDEEKRSILSSIIAS